ncbi:ead/Ea22-like family protein [Salmonella enterica subsp. enterica]|nr:ead/Ea22-like family protein [Salmonella enterica subsp. enterica serovar Chandans]
MSNIDKRALREVAERATPGNWRRTSSLFNGITVTPFSLCGEEVTLAHTVEKRDAEFIAAANPATMLALLDENIQLQREKDAIEAVALALRDDMRQARELWRNQTDDVIQFRQRIAELEAKLETADKLQDSAFRDGLKARFSYGQTDDQSGFAQCMSAYSTRTGIKVKGE